MPFGKSKRVQQILRLRFGGGEHVDIVWNGDPEGNETFADLLMIYRSAAGGTVETTPSGARILVNWATVSTVHIVQ